MPEAIPNEFGIPQDEDWDIDSLVQEPQPLEQQTESVQEADADVAFDPTDADLEAAINAALEEPQPQEPQTESEQEAGADTAFDPTDADLEAAINAALEETQSQELQTEIAQEEADTDTAFDPTDADLEAAINAALEETQSQELQTEIAQEEADADAVFDPTDADLEAAINAALEETQSQELQTEIAQEEAGADTAFDPTDVDLEAAINAALEEPQPQEPQTEIVQETNAKAMPVLDTQERDVLHDLLQSSADDSLSSAESEQQQHQDLETWLDEDHRHDAPLDIPSLSDEDLADSVGLNIDAMLDVGGEDWNGFSLSPEQRASISDEIPDDEQEIWATQGSQPRVQNENWAEQAPIESNDLQDKGYKTIDELMAEMSDDTELEPVLSLQPEIAVEPDHDPDQFGLSEEADHEEAANKLELAQMYIEMNDLAGAKKLLEEAIIDGDDHVRREAKNLIDSLGSL